MLLEGEGEGERGGGEGRERREGKKLVAIGIFAYYIYTRWRSIEVTYSRERMIHALGLLGMERILGHRGDNTSLPRALIPT